MPSFTASVTDLVTVGPVLQVFVGPSREFITAIGADTAAFAPFPVASLVDTGAESTVLNPAAVSLLSIRPVGAVLMHTPTTVEPVRCRQFHINIYFSHDFAIENILAIEAPMSGQPFQCLIGRDVLRHGSLLYGGSENRFTLKF